ncbi:MAG: glycine cleavage system aminomethyltransferase GcvT [Erythrobacter sp.]|uniref:glycine cleavage system aminomethyltransferase GcvT n=1 Tax=Erythrobacter sp. TaxID=1042 RepID=UPI003C757053
MSDENEPQDQQPEELPLDAWHRGQGARMVSFAGYEMPIQYEGIVAEHNWTREHASLFDVSHMGQLSVTSPQDDPELAARELEKLLPGAIASLKPGKMRYSLLLSDSGGILDDLMVTNAGPHLSLVVNGARKWDDIAHLREHLPDDLTLTHYDDFALLALQGPDAGGVLEALVPGTGALTFMTGCLFEWEGQHLWVSRAGYTGEDGFEISLHAGAAEAFASALVADERVRPAGLGARDSLRLEAGLPLYGHDLDEDIDPVTADLVFALSKKRRETGGFLGHMAVAARLADEGAGTLARRRVGLLLDGRLPAREGAEVFSGDRMVGKVTSGGFSPTLGRPIAMAYVDVPHASEGAALECEVRGKRLPASVAPMPFVPHRYYRGS